MIEKFMVRSLAFLLLGTSLAAQAKVVKVYVGSEDNKASKDVGDILRGKVGSTLRYGLSEPGPAEITIDVICLDAAGGVACTAPAYYYPESGKGLSGHLGLMVATGSPLYVAQSLFDSFVESSSDPNLTKVEKIITAGSSQHWFEGFNEGYQAGLKATCGDSKKPPAKPKSN